MDARAVEYARSGDVAIAYQVMGDGPLISSSRRWPSAPSSLPGTSRSRPSTGGSPLSRDCFSSTSVELAPPTGRGLRPRSRHRWRTLGPCSTPWARSRQRSSAPAMAGSCVRFSPPHTRRGRPPSSSTTVGLASPERPKRRTHSFGGSATAGAGRRRSSASSPSSTHLGQETSSSSTRWPRSCAQAQVPRRLRNTCGQ
jgi:hypothetical protein